MLLKSIHTFGEGDTCLCKLSLRRRLQWDSGMSPLACRCHVGANQEEGCSMGRQHRYSSKTPSLLTYLFYFSPVCDLKLGTVGQEIIK